MGTDFSLDVNKKANELHVNLTGDFDADAALSVFNVLSYCERRAARVFLHTEKLGLVHELGQIIFQSLCLNLREIQDGATDLTLTGNKIAL
ncbi:MAG: hypothetical protein LJE96_00885 [Deltaproteobacteria bacterium]|jgi:hypothetical protein|nr:hypothetical protein [Deltaproteobacteria bacterium]